MYGLIPQSMGRVIIKTRPNLTLIEYIKNTASGLWPGDFISELVYYEGKV